MEKELSQEFFLSVGECNAEGEMSLTLLTSKLIDIATSHANLLGIGNPDMPDDHSGWVLSRLTIEMREYPKKDSNYRITTWVEGWNRHFSERVFCIKNADNDEILGYARSIWMVLDTLTRANAGLDRLSFDKELISDRDCPIDPPEKHRLIVMPDEIDQPSPRILVASHPAMSYIFRYSDLDAYRHVNTVRYIGLLMNQIPLEIHDKNIIRRIELSFLQEGEYGKEIEILRADLNEPERSYAYLLRKKDDKQPIIYASVSLKSR